MGVASTGGMTLRCHGADYHQFCHDGYSNNGTIILPSDLLYTHAKPKAMTGFYVLFVSWI